MRLSVYNWIQQGASATEAASAPAEWSAMMMRGSNCPVTKTGKHVQFVAARTQGLVVCANFEGTAFLTQAKTMQLMSSAPVLDSLTRQTHPTIPARRFSRTAALSSARRLLGPVSVSAQHDSTVSTDAAAVDEHALCPECLLTS